MAEEETTGKGSSMQGAENEKRGATRLTKLTDCIMYFLSSISSALHYFGVIIIKSAEQQLKNKKIKVHNINIDGLRVTRTDLVQPKIHNVFEAATFEELVKEMYLSKNYLEDLDIFHPVNVFIDAASDKKADPIELDVTFRVRELSRFSAQFKTEVGNQDSRLVIGGKLRNLFGRAEELMGSIAYGAKKSTTLQLSFIKPLFGDKEKSLTSTLYQGTIDFVQSSFKEISRGIGFQYPIITEFGAHSLHFDSVWREIQCLSDRSSWAVREESGHSLKCSIKHAFMRDTRDHSVSPTTGHFIRFEQEHAGLGSLGDTKFHRFFLECQYNKTLPYNIVFSSSLNLGLLASDGQSKISDRFFLGGPLSIRGFQMRGIGPHSEGDSIGGNALWASGLHLISPLPFKPLQGGFGERLRTHLFVNAGNLGHIRSSAIRDSTEELIRGYRWSYGIGLLVKLGVAQLELNYCVPCRAHATDRISPGFQFGVGLSFL
ncbi:Sorting and assembly machinery component 50-like protein [Trichoplax sp. H2]|nr:Sorting and assembly machinery component 50-like protein [Trichoplax sp. H2]|eukprot:RDD43359.1 Sorting and assembly machinery component 50-like protein [Trichoplax sp. H2]